jgi:aminoglycoside phosphotransferase (APT) family kinase protein
VVRLNRLPEEAMDWQLLADESVSRALAAAGVVHPEVVLVDCSRGEATTDFEVAEFIDAPSLSTFDADDAAIAPWLATAARYLKRVHAVRGERFGFVDVSRAPSLVGLHVSWPAYLRVQLAENIAMAAQAGLLSAPEREAAVAQFERGLPALGAVQPCLLHGDTGNHNILARADGSVVFIDWEDALLGDPLFDLAFWATFHPERRWPALFEAYFGAPWQPDARFWLYFLRVAISKTVHRLRFGYTDRPDRPRASLRMQRALQGLAEAGSIA